MNNPVFDRSEFRLCDVPVPKGYPQSQTHAGVVSDGEKYYLTTSPYPGPDYGIWEWRIRRLIRILSFGKLCSTPNGEVFENPCLYVGKRNEECAPAKFILMQKTALIETPEEFNGLPSYNSDPDIFLEGDQIYILNRSVIRTKSYDNHGHYDFDTRIYLLKGLDENNCFKLLSNILIREGHDPFVSPSLVKLQGNYIVGYLDNRIAGREVVFNNLYLSIADSIEESIKSKNSYTIFVEGVGLIPWHISLFVYNEILYAIVTCVKKGDDSLKMWQMLGEFDKELKKLFIFPRPLTDMNSYRGSALVDKKGIFVLYTPTVHEKIVGSKSIDGRDILVATKKFEDILSQVKI